LRKIGIFSLMENSAHRIIKNLEVLPELGRQRCFELGNPFYYQDAADAAEPGNEKGNYYRKELPSGELYIVTIEINPIKDESYEFKDTIIRKLR
jgi:hypothetical protein